MGGNHLIFKRRKHVRERIEMPLGFEV